jgi:hypothetical protein
MGADFLLFVRASLAVNMLKENDSPIILILLSSITILKLKYNKI